MYHSADRVVLIDITWLGHQGPGCDPVSPHVIQQQFLQHAQHLYSVKHGMSWPSLDDILANADSFRDHSGFLQLELQNFKQELDEHLQDLTDRNNSCYANIRQWILDHQHDIDYIVFHNLLDPCDPDVFEHMFGFTRQLPCKTFRFGWFANAEQVLDNGVLIVDQYMSLPANLDVTGSAIDVPFMCLNGKPRAYRRALVTRLRELGLDQKGLVSLDGQGIKENNHLKNSSILSDPFDAMSLGDTDNWNRHFLNVVTESVFNVERYNIYSEKICKPILGHRPFLVFAPNGGIGVLERSGFMHYCDDFQDISDLDLRQPDNIPEFLAVLSSQDPQYWTDKFHQLSNKIRYNRRQFDRYVQQQWRIVLDGFDHTRCQG
jgi:hypothetical protein